MARILVPRTPPERPVHRCHLRFSSSLILLLTLFSCSRLVPGPEVRSSQKSTEPQTLDLIARVKDVPASNLQKGLPAVRFEDWVRDTAGPDWALTWSFTRGPKNESNHALDFPDSVDVRGDTKDGRYFRLSIGVTTNANQILVFWLSGAANVQHGWVGLQHLSQLPGSLHRASKSSHASAG